MKSWKKAKEGELKGKRLFSYPQVENREESRGDFFYFTKYEIMKLKFI
jgi:hypothetical protein